jgi:hypothetical protein
MVESTVHLYLFSSATLLMIGLGELKLVYMCSLAVLELM